MNINLYDRVRGSLIGGAIGDALGYPIEFMSLKAIKHKYGDKGYINHQEFNNSGKAVISDDTQMTLMAMMTLNILQKITIVFSSSIFIALKIDLQSSQLEKTDMDTSKMNYVQD